MTALRNDAQCSGRGIEGHFSARHGVLSLAEAEREFWSTQLGLTIEDAAPRPDGESRPTRVLCIFSPQPQVWTAYVFAIGVLAAIFVFTAYQTAGGSDEAEVPVFTVPGPDIGVDANACVRILAGGALLEVPCDGARDGVVIGARLVDGVCPAGTVRESLVKPGVVACLAP